MTECNDNYGCLRVNIDIINVQRSVFADGASGPILSRSSSRVLARRDDNLYWFTEVLFFSLKSHGVAESDEELSIVHYFEVTLPMDEIDRNLHCLSPRWTTNEDIDHSIGFNPGWSGITESGE